MYLGSVLDSCFHENSYDFIPCKLAIQAVSIIGERRWEICWLFEFDIKRTFDNIDHSLLTRVLKKHTGCEWVLLYIDRWVEAPMQHPDGVSGAAKQGYASGGVVSPLLMNMFLHYLFDKLMAADEPRPHFARFVDDARVHCSTLRDARG